MTATYELNLDELSPEFVDQLKRMFKKGRIEIRVTETDETDEIRQNSALHERLLRSLDEVRSGGGVVITQEQLHGIVAQYSV